MSSQPGASTRRTYHGNGPSAIQAVRTLAPNVVLLDLFLPGQDGLGVLAQIKQDRPAIELNQDVMARYRPAMRRLYYDPTKYKTYLDQLGIAYPTVRAADGSCAGGATP